MSTDDAFDLQRFVRAQAGGVYAQALAEVRRGRKSGRWMWFVFPQLRGLGMSWAAKHYGIAGLQEARAYLAHPVLGPRLRDCAEAVATLRGRSARSVFGSPDDVKLCSSLTLFETAAPSETLFGEALASLCEGRRDPRTLAMLGDGSS